MYAGYAWQAIADVFPLAGKFGDDDFYTDHFAVPFSDYSATPWRALYRTPGLGEDILSRQVPMTQTGYTIALFDEQVVPEPGSFTLFGFGVGMLGIVGWRRRRRQIVSSH